MAVGAALAGLVSSEAIAADRHVTVFAAASLADAFQEIAGAVERQRAGLSVQFNFAGSQQLAIQLERGATADVFASADERWMTYALDHGAVEAPALFARNSLIVIVPASNPARIRRLGDLGRPGVKLVIGAEAVPAGRYSRTMLHRLAHQPGADTSFARRVLANVVSEEENVKAVAAKVQLGEADAGIVYRSDVTRALARRVRTLEIPAAVNVVAIYPIALVKGTARGEDGRAFIAAVLSPAGQAILKRHGLIPALGSAP